MIKQYHDFVLRLAADGHRLTIDINGWPIDINLPQPIKIKLKSHLPRQGNLANVLTQDIAQLGYSLYDLIFVKEVGEQFQAYLNQRKNDVGIRVCINIQSGELSDTIWEILCDRLMPSPNFLSLDPKTPVVRSLRIGKQLDDLEMRIPLKLLVVISSPRLMEQIDRNVEKAMLEQALGQVKAKRRITVDYLGFENPLEADFGRLQEYLAGQDTPYDIVHIIGHGLLENGEEGRVALVEPQGGKMQDVRASSLANLFRSRGVMLVILQSCQSGAVDPSALYFSSAAQQLVASGVPAVIAMQEKIDQEVARYFIEKLYTRWLDSECPLEDALTQARQDIYQRFPDQVSSWAIPVLYIRPGAYLVPSWQTQSVETTERQIDAAIPQQIRAGKETDLVTLIRKPTTRGLREILSEQPQDFDVTPEDVKTSPEFDVLFPVDEKSGKTLPKNISMVIESNDFDPPRTEERIQLSPQVDRVWYYFTLTPKQEGSARLLVKLIDIDTTGKPVTLTQLRLRTEVRGGKAFETRYGFVSSSTREYIMTVLRCSLGHENPRGSIFCDECGEPLAPATPASVAPPGPFAAAVGTQVCPSCRAINPEGEAFCSNCGSMLVAYPSTPASAVSVAPSPVAVSAPAALNARLIVEADNQEFDLSGKDSVVIGLEDAVSNIFPDVDLTPHGGEEGGVSRLHARIFVENGQYMIEDENSTNFTFLNRQKLAPKTPTPLQDNDEIKLGRVVLRFKVA